MGHKREMLNFANLSFQGETTEEDGSVNNILDALAENPRSSSAVEVSEDSVMVVGMGDGESGVGSTSPTGSSHPNSSHNEVEQEDYEHVYCQLDPYFVSSISLLF